MSVKTKKDFGSLAALKRRMKAGTSLLCVENNKRPELNGQRRVVVKPQGDSFKWRMEGETQPSWTSYPAAKDLKWLDEDTFKIQMAPEYHVTLRFIP